MKTLSEHCSELLAALGLCCLIGLGLGLLILFLGPFYGMPITFSNACVCITTAITAVIIYNLISAVTFLLFFKQ